MRTATRYLLVQLPSALLLAVVLWLLHLWIELPAWLAWLLLALWLVKDAALYPLVRRAYEPSAPHPAGSLLGTLGRAREPLAPSGYIEIRGELWRATVAGGATVQAGGEVRVLDARGLTLVVEPAADGSREE